MEKHNKKSAKCTTKKLRVKKRKASLKRKSFHHLNQNQRDRMEAMINAGHTQKEIAQVLKVNPCTISRERRERKRKNGYYDADTAQMKARSKRRDASYQGMKVDKDMAMKRHIIAELKTKHSPDEISGRMIEENMLFYTGKDSIYKWLYSVYGQQYCKYLCTKRYKRRKQKRGSKREMIPNRVSFEKRPIDATHLEGDTFVSPTKLGTTVSGAIVVAVKSKLILGQIIKNRKPVTMRRAVNKCVVQINNVNTDITFDNGIENKEHEQLLIPAYFTNPHSPWQKPHVENGIGLLRRWFIPKGTDLRKVSNSTLQEYLHVLNNKYRKSLGYRSAYEVALEIGLIDEIPKN